MEVLAEAVRPGDPVVVLPAALGAEQRRAVPPHQSVDQVAVLEVEARDDVVVLAPDRRIGGAGGQLRKIDRVELGRVHDGERVRREGEIARRLVLVLVGGLSGVTHVPRAEPEVPHAGEGHPRVEFPAAAVGPHEAATRGDARAAQEALRRHVQVVGRLVVVVVVALERQPVGEPVGRSRVRAVARAIGTDMLVGENVQRVRGVRLLVRDVRRIGRPVRVRGEQVDVRLEEPRHEERRARPLVDLIVVRLAEEAPRREVEPRGQRLIQVQAEVLAVVALEQQHDAVLLGVLERDVVVGVALPLPDRDVVRVVRAVGQQVALHVETHGVRVVGVGNIGDPVRLGAGYGICTSQTAAGVDEIPLHEVIPARVGAGGGGGQVRVRVRDGDLLGPERLAILVAHRHRQLAVGDSVAALGEDLHDPVRGIGPVQRRRRRALHDLHPLDVLGADVGEGVVGDRAVHHDQRTRNVGRGAWLRIA